jgi:hypothetical protein
LQKLTIDCRPCLAFKPGSLALLGRGGLRALNLKCDWLGADTLQQLGCLTGLTQLRVATTEGVHVPGDPDAAASPATALAHLTALSGLTRLAHLDLDLGGPMGDLQEAPAAELLDALPRAPLEQVQKGVAVVSPAASRAAPCNACSTTCVVTHLTFRPSSVWRALLTSLAHISPPHTHTPTGCAHKARRPPLPHMARRPPLPPLL